MNANEIVSIVEELALRVQRLERKVKILEDPPAPKASEVSGGNSSTYREAKNAEE